jgi:hypothetical protein
VRNRNFQFAVLLLTHVADAVLTALGLADATIVELNPVLAAAWDSHPINFFLTKFALVGGCSFVIACYWHDSRVRYALYAVNAFMVALVTYEVMGVLL